MSQTLFDGMALTVEVGFSTTAGSGTVPLGAALSSITWTDITAYVREVTTSRGRSSELDSYSAGSCQLILDNRTRLFDPEYTSGTYYGKLTPLRPIRIRVTPKGGTIRSIFFGFIEQWPQSYSYPKEATVSVTASDAFKVLNEFRLPSYWYTTIAASNPLIWYRLSDPQGSANAFDVIAGSSVSSAWRGVSTTFTTSVSSGALLADDSASSSAFDGNKWFQAWDVLGGYTFSANQIWSAEMWISTTENTPGSYGIFNHSEFIQAGHCGMIVDANGIGTISGCHGGRSGGSSFFSAFASTIQVNDGRPHQIVMTHEDLFPSGAATFNLYVDGVAAGVGTAYVPDTGSYLSLSLGLPIVKSTVASNNFTNYFKGSIQDFIVWNSALSAATVQQHYEIGTGIYAAGTRTDQRITLLTNLANWITDGTDLNTGDTTVQGVKTNGKGLLDALKEVEKAEQGRIFMSVDGKIRFINRNAEGSGNFVTSQQTFSDAPGVGEIAYASVEMTYDDRYIFNEIRTTQPDGTAYTASDSSSQGKYFKRTLTIDDFIADSSYYVTNTSIYKLAQYKNPQLRTDQLTVNVRKSTAYQSPCVTLDIGDRVTVKRTPQNIGTQISKALIVEGVKHHITRDNWVATFNTSPTLQNAPFVLDSATLGVLDTNILAY